MTAKELRELLYKVDDNATVLTISGNIDATIIDAQQVCGVKSLYQVCNIETGGKTLFIHIEE